MATPKTAGKHPAEPAVGVAQTRPILAFSSLTAMAFLAADSMEVSDSVIPPFIYASSFAASPPVNPETDLLSERPSIIEFFITVKFLDMIVNISSRFRPVSSISVAIISSETLPENCSACETNSSIV